MGKKVVFAGSFAGVAALAIGIAAYKALIESTEPGAGVPSTVNPDKAEVKLAAVSTAR